MWIFNRNKGVFLADIIPDDFVDIHNHILPGIDDGAASSLDSIELITQLKELNISKFIATPHNIEGVWENDPEKVNNSLQNLVNEKDFPLIETDIKASSEYMLDKRLSDLLENKKVVPIKERYLLVEMSYFAAPLNLYELIFDIQNYGYTPILAHPERYNFLHGNMKEYKKLKQVGCLFQLNLIALTGYYGFGPKMASEELLSAQLYDYVGTDAHHVRHTSALKGKIIVKKSEILKPLIQANTFFSF